jgi:hypothetical protein
MILKYKHIFFHEDYQNLIKVLWQLDNWYLGVSKESIKIQNRINDIVQLIENVYIAWKLDENEDNAYQIFQITYINYIKEINILFSKFKTDQYDRKAFVNQYQIRIFFSNLQKIGIEKNDIVALEDYMFENDIYNLETLMECKIHYSYNKKGPFYHLHTLSKTAILFFRIIHNLKYFYYIDYNHMRAFYYDKNMNFDIVANILSKSNQNMYFRKFLFKTIKNRLNTLHIIDEKKLYIEYLENFNINFKFLRNLK